VWGGGGGVVGGDRGVRGGAGGGGGQTKIAESVCERRQNGLEKLRGRQKRMGMGIERERDSKSNLFLKVWCPLLPFYTEDTL